MKFLLIEDDQKIAAYIAKGFRESGDVVDIQCDGRDGLAMALEGDYDLLIIDVMLPGRDGLSVIEEMRARGLSTPVIILSAKKSVEDRVRGLETGSDDYLTKPFSFTELQARVQALLRRSLQHNNADTGLQSELRFSDLVLEPYRKTVTRSGKQIRLQPREFQLLEYMLQNQAGYYLKRWCWSMSGNIVLIPRPMLLMFWSVAYAVRLTKILHRN